MNLKDRMENVSQAVLFRIIVLLLGIIYGTLHHYRVVPEDLNTALTVTLLLFLVEQFFEIGYKLDRSEGLDTLATNITRYLSKDSALIGALLKTLHEEISRSLMLLDDGFRVSHPALAIHSYLRFWGLLVEEQRKRGSALPTLHIEAVHSCSMDIWSTHRLSPRLLELQREFIRLGGHITRILCSEGASPDTQVFLAYSKMMEAGIDVRYFDISTDVVEHSFGWDFLYIRETRRSVIWNSFAKGAGGIINEAVYLNSMNYEDKDLTAISHGG